MLSDSAFLRNVPDFFDGEHSIHLDAVVFASDAAAISMESIRASAAAYGSQICKAPGRVHTKIMIDVWTVINSLHVVIKLLEAMEYKTDSGPAFCADFAAASRLRNSMSHLHGLAKNVSQSKRRPPVFGALAYLCVPDEFIKVTDGVQSVVGVGSAVITAGRAADVEFTVLNPKERQFTIPVSNFYFEAFNERIDLDKAEIALYQLVNELNSTLESKATEFVNLNAEGFGKTPSELLSAAPSRIVAFMPMYFVPEEQLSEEIKRKPFKIDFSPSPKVSFSMTQKPNPKK